MNYDVTTAILICLIPALVLLAFIYYINRAAAPRRKHAGQGQAHEALAKYQTQVSRMGQYIGGPRTTIHSLINKLFKTNKVSARVAALPAEEFADVSYWQRFIN